MSAIKKLLAGTAGVAALLGVASPAAAQYYPGYGYGGGYGNNPGAVVGQVINGVIAATQYGGYQHGNYGYGQTYRYGNQTIPANVAVNQCARAVEARLNGGRYNSGYGGDNSGYGGYNSGYGNAYGYGQGGGGGQVSGITSIESRNRGALRIHGVISTMANYGYQGGYGGGYGYNGGYQGGNVAPSLSFSCKVDYSGRVTDLQIDRFRGYGYNRGYNQGW